MKSKNNDYPTCITDSNNTITNPIEISKTFNKYFSNIADTILNKRKYHGNKSYSVFLSDPTPNSITDEFHDTNGTEIFDIISKFKNHKSSGPSSIPIKILKLLKFEISQPLAQLINLSFSTGNHPDKLKIAQVIPVFKKGSKLLTSNYRPISLLSNLNKIFEKIMFNRVNTFLEKNECLYQLQFGFRGKHSTNHALINIIDTISEALDKNKVACGIFVDFQKAFDTVNHEILIKKLSHYGIRGNINNWFKSYLKDRKQFVSILGYESDLSTLSHGVPQGSVLGPLLFLIYINDLNKAIKHSTVYHFADDTNMLKIANSHKEIANKMNKDLKCLNGWLLANKISLNTTKTELIFFKKPMSPPPPPSIKIKLNGFKLKPSNCIKYLGIIIDENLKGLSHCKQLQPKLIRANGMLAKTRHFVPTHELLSIYHATFSANLLYGCQTWGQHTNPLYKKIETLQNNAMRIMTFSDHRAHTGPIYKSLKILKLKDQISLSNCLFVYDQINNKLPKSFNSYFMTTAELYPNVTRSSKTAKLFIPQVNSVRYGRQSIKYSCINTWNHFTKIFSNTDFMKILRNDLKILITNNFLESY